MSAETTDTNRVQELVITMCDRCGTTRTVARRSARAHRLRCATCGMSTHHSAIDAEPDWREDSNRRSNGDLFKYTQDLDVARRLGVRVFEARDIEEDFAELRRYEDGTWMVGIQQQLPISERNRMLRWAWKNILPSAITAWRWEESLVFDNDDGLGPWRGCHYVPTLADRATADEFARTLRGER